MQEYRYKTSHRPKPLPSGRWLMSQRWNDLLFAHWPLNPSQIAPLLPEWLDVDVHQGKAWLGAVPFWLDRIKIRGVPPLPGARSFPDLSLRTYVRDRFTGAAGIYCFSMDSSNLLAVAVARMAYHLAYHWSSMSLTQRSEREFDFSSKRRFTSTPVNFKARYRGLGPSARLAEVRPGSLEFFMTERGCVFSSNRAGEPIRSSLHYIPLPLEEAEAEIEHNDLPASIGIELPDIEPVLHYTRRLAVYIWPAEVMRHAMARRPVAVAITPST